MSRAADASAPILGWIFLVGRNYSAEVEAYSLKNLKVASRITMIDRRHSISSGNRSIDPVNSVNYVKNIDPCHNAMVG